MKALRTILFIAALLVQQQAIGQEQLSELKNYWQIGIGLGELPIDGSFKPSITLGYYFGNDFYAGVIYQFRDKISRNESSFNAKSSGLEGLQSASEIVAQRFMFQVRYAPIKNGPYLSTGIVYNGKDVETMQFDHRSRVISGESYQGTLQIQQIRPAGWGLALGLGYQYNFRNGLSAGFEWTPAWGQYPKPSYTFSSEPGLSSQAKDHLQHKMDREFRSSVTNLYKIFHIGVAYRFK